MSMLSALVICVCVSLFVGTEAEFYSASHSGVGSYGGLSAGKSAKNPKNVKATGKNDNMADPNPMGNTGNNPDQNGAGNAGNPTGQTDAVKIGNPTGQTDVVNAGKNPDPNGNGKTGKIKDNAGKINGNTGMMGQVNENLKKKWGRMFDYYNMNASDGRINKYDLKKMGAQLIAYGYTAKFAGTVVHLAIKILGDALRYLPPKPTRSPDVGVTKDETIMIFQKQMAEGTLMNDEYRKDLFNLLLKQPGCKNGKLSGDVVRIFEMGMGLDGASAKRTTELIGDFQISMRAYVNAYAVYFTDTSSYASLEKFPLFGL